MADSTNVRRWSGSGAALVDLDGEGTLPTDATTPIPSDFDDLGYLGDSGVVISENADTQSVFAWQNGANVRTIQTTHDVTFAFELLESTELTYEVCYGNVDTNGGVTAVELRGEQPGRAQWVIQAYDGDEALRIVIPSGQITEKGDVSLLHTDATRFPITVTAYPDSSGVKAYIYQETLASA